MLRAAPMQPCTFCLLLNFTLACRLKREHFVQSLLRNCIIKCINVRDALSDGRRRKADKNHMMEARV
jgi:hypothetical protein